MLASLAGGVVALHNFVIFKSRRCEPHSRLNVRFFELEIFATDRITRPGKWATKT